MSDIVYWIKAYSDFQYNVGLSSLQSDIRGSDTRVSPISLNMDIGLVTDKGNGRQPACPEELKKCKEEHEY
jgi:hypothetical protein